MTEITSEMLAKYEFAARAERAKAMKSGLKFLRESIAAFFAGLTSGKGRTA